MGPDQISWFSLSVLNEMYLFVFLTDLKVKLMSHSAPPEGNCSSRGAIFSANVSLWGIAPLGAQFFSANVSLWENFHF